MATHSSIPAWRIPQTEKPGRIQSIGPQSVEHDWSDFAHRHAWYWFRDRGQFPSSLVIGRIRFLTFIHWMRSSFPWHVILNPQANHTASNPSDCSNLQIPLLSSLAFNSSCDHIGGEASLQTKLVEVMKFQVSYLKSWKMMLSKCYTQCASKFGKLNSGHRTGKGQFSSESQRKATPKNAQTTAQLHSSHMLAK